MGIGNWDLVGISWLSLYKVPSTTSYLLSAGMIKGSLLGLLLIGKLLSQFSLFVSLGGPRAGPSLSRHKRHQRFGNTKYYCSFAISSNNSRCGFQLGPTSVPGGIWHRMEKTGVHWACLRLPAAVLFLEGEESLYVSLPLLPLWMPRAVYPWNVPESRRLYPSVLHSVHDPLRTSWRLPHYCFSVVLEIKMYLNHLLFDSTSNWGEINKLGILN